MRPRLAALVLLWCIAPPAIAQQPGHAPNPFDGEWSLTFRIATPPGGFVRVREAMTISPGHLQFQAEKQFTVGRDGKIAA